MQNDMRDRLVELLAEIHNCCPKKSSCEKCEYRELENCRSYSDADFLIANGVVPVVRCKDCKHCRKDTYFDYCDKYSRPFDKLYVEKDHFCSYGERKEDNGKL